MLTNRVKQLLRRGKPAFGCWVYSGSPAVVEVLGKLGFDYVAFDTEHGGIDIGTLMQLIRAADGAGLPSMVKLPENRSSLILSTLDVGALGVHVPQVFGKSDAEKAVRAAKFSPEGERGLAFGHRAPGYGLDDQAKYMVRANAETMVNVIVESRRGVETLPETLRVPGIDVVCVGTVDLSQDLGIPGEVDHPQIWSALEGVVSQARSAGVAVGVSPGGNLVRMRRLLEIGVRYITFSSDLGLLAQASKSALGELFASRR